MARPEDADEEVTAMLQEVRTLSKEAFFGEDSVQKSRRSRHSKDKYGLCSKRLLCELGSKILYIG